MDETSIRNLVKGWQQRVRGEHDPVSRFVFLWFCFNAWLSHESEEDLDRDMVEWLKADTGRSQLKLSYDLALGSELFRGQLQTLVNLSPIERTGRRHGEVRIADIEDFAGIVEGIYQVRCNLFHGGKRAGDPRDQKLIATCARILEKWVGNLVGSWRSAS